MYGINLLESKCGIVKIEPLFPNMHILDKPVRSGFSEDNDTESILDREDHHIPLDILAYYALGRLTNKDFEDILGRFYCPKFNQHIEKCPLCKGNLKYYKTYPIF
jgi:hypothetical protein